MISAEPNLQLSEFDKPFEVHTGASWRALGGVLIQDGRPVAFDGQKLIEAEERYSTHEKEMLPVVHCLRIWWQYFLGTKFTLLTDNVANHILSITKDFIVEAGLLDGIFFFLEEMTLHGNTSLVDTIKFLMR